MVSPYFESFQVVEFRKRRVSYTYIPLNPGQNDEYSIPQANLNNHLFIMRRNMRVPPLDRKLTASTITINGWIASFRINLADFLILYINFANTFTKGEQVILPMQQKYHEK